MTNAQTILIIILACTLIVFLVAAIVALVVSIKLLADARRVIGRANDVIEIAGEASANFRKVAGPLAIFKVVRDIMKLQSKKHR